MIKMKNSEFRVQNFIIIFCISFLTLNSALLTPAFAADSSPSADIKVKLEELKKEIASKAAKLKQVVDRKLKDKAYIGKVKSKTDTSLTLAVKSGTKIVSINQDTIFESNVKGKKFSQTRLAEENYIAALGDIDETGVLTAKKIILLPEPDIPKSYLWGQVISANSKITIKTRDSKTVPASIPSSSTVKLNDFVILVGNKDENDIFVSEFVYVVPQGVIIKPKKTATTSAQTATKSASH